MSTSIIQLPQYSTESATAPYSSDEPVSSRNERIEERDSLSRLQREVLEAQRRYYEACSLEMRKKSLRDSCRSMLSFEYLKQITPSVILLIVAIVALYLSAQAQQNIADVNSTVDSSIQNARQVLVLVTNQSLFLSQTIGSLQGQFNDLDTKFNQLQAIAEGQISSFVNQSIVVAENKIGASLAPLQATIQNLTQQLNDLQIKYLNLTQQTNASLSTAIHTLQQAQQMQADTQNFVLQKFNESLQVMNEIQQINTSYPYPWNLQDKLNKLTIAHNNTENEVSSLSNQLLSVSNQINSGNGIISVQKLVLPGWAIQIETSYLVIRDIHSGGDYRFAFSEAKSGNYP